MTDSELQFTKLVKEHPEMLLLTSEWAHEYVTWWDSWYLSPVNPAVDAYTTDLLKMFIERWNFDGLKIDGQHLNCCLPDYNEHTGLDNVRAVAQSTIICCRLLTGQWLLTR